MDYQIIVTSIPQDNVVTKENDVIIKEATVKLPYGTMKNRSFRIDDDMMTKILDSGTPAIKVFRYIKSHVNSQTNKVSLKANDVIDYINTYGLKCNNAEVTRGIKALIKIDFIIKANTLKIYSRDAANIYLVNPNYCVISSVDVVFRRIQSDERSEYEFERIQEEDRRRKELSDSAIRIKLKKRNGNIESKNQETSAGS